MAFCVCSTEPTAVSWNLMPRSFSAVACAPCGHSTPSVRTRRVTASFLPLRLPAASAEPLRLPAPAMAAPPTAPLFRSSRRLRPRRFSLSLMFELLLSSGTCAGVPLRLPARRQGRLTTIGTAACVRRACSRDAACPVTIRSLALGTAAHRRARGANCRTRAWCLSAEVRHGKHLYTHDGPFRQWDGRAIVRHTCQLHNTTTLALALEAGRPTPRRAGYAHSSASAAASAGSSAQATLA